MGLLGRFVVGSALLLGVVACSTSRSTSTPPPSPPSSPGAPTSAAAVTTQDNVAATRKFSAWLLHAVPMPPGAREWTKSPTAHYRNGSVTIGPSDPAFGRTTWWTVAMSREELASWLHAHSPKGLHVEPDDPTSIEASGVWEHDVQFRAPSTPAHTMAWVNVAFTHDGDRLAVRVDTFVGARFARTVRVPTDTTSVTIRRTETSLIGRHRGPHTKVRTITDAGAVAKLVAMVNALPGSMTTDFVASCPATLREGTYAMTFAGPHGTYVASVPMSNCWPQLTLSKDGVATDPSLDPGRQFVRTAERHLD